MHDGHRERIRHQILETGLESLPPHNVLELLLFYSIPRGDVNPTAHRLLNSFGTLDAVFEAPVPELLKVPGIGESSALLIKMIPQLMKRLARDRAAGKLSFDNTAEFKRFVASCFIDLPEETLMLFSLNNSGQLINYSVVSRGTKHNVAYDNRTIIEAAVRNNASKIALAHNHPLGVAAPSKRDIGLTEELVDLFARIGIRVLDHYIVSAEDCFSMAFDSPKFFKIFLNLEGR